MILYLVDPLHLHESKVSSVGVAYCVTLSLPLSARLCVSVSPTCWYKVQTHIRGERERERERCVRGEREREREREREVCEGRERERERPPLSMESIKSRCVL